METAESASVDDLVVGARRLQRQTRLQAARLAVSIRMSLGRERADVPLRKMLSVLTEVCDPGSPPFPSRSMD